MNDHDTTDASTPDGSRSAEDSDGTADEPRSSATGEATVNATDGSDESTTLELLEEIRPLVWPAVRIAGLVLLIALVLPFVAYAVPQVAGADHSFVVLSGSMEPEISTGDVVLVAGVEPEAIEAGDVITYQRTEGESPTTHRVIEVDDSGNGVQFRTKGDANEDPDQTAIAADQVIGRVTITIPAIGHVITFVNTPVGFGLLVVLPLVSLGLSEVWALRSKRRSDDSDDSPAANGFRPDGTAGSTESVSVAPPDGGETATASDASPHSMNPDTASDSPNQYVLTKSDLLLSTGVLGVLVAYSAWTIYTGYVRTGTPGIISTMVGTGSATALVLALIARSRLSDGLEPDSSEPPARVGSDDATTASTAASDSDDGDVAAPTAVSADGSPLSPFEWFDINDSSREGTDPADHRETDAPSAGTSDAVLGDPVLTEEHSGDTDDE